MFNFFKKRKQLKTTETPTAEQPLTPIVVVETEEDRWAKQYVFDFLEGKVPAKQFLKDIIEKKEIFAWLEKIQPKREEEYGKVQSNWTVKKIVAPYDIKRSILDGMVPAYGLYGQALNIQWVLVNMFKEVFPDKDWQIYPGLQETSDFLITAVPEYLDSIAIMSSELFDGLLEEFPATMPKTKRVKLFKEKLKEMFYVEGQKYPRWLQESEWPLSPMGKPTKFLRQKTVHGGEATIYYFLDMDTNEEIEIMQAF